MSQYGNCRISTVVPAVDTVQYSAGDCVGGLLEFGNLGAVNGRGVLKGLTIVDAANQKAALTLLIFRTKPAGTFTNNSANAITAADLKKVAAKVNIAASDYETINSLAIATIDISQVIQADDAMKRVYGLLVTTGTPTYTAEALQLGLGILAD